MKRKMQKLVAQLAGILIVLLGVTLLSFSLMYIAPGDPARTILQAGGTMPSEEAIQEKREEMDWIAHSWNNTEAGCGILSMEIWECP